MAWRRRRNDTIIRCRERSFSHSRAAAAGRSIEFLSFPLAGFSGIVDGVADMPTRSSRQRARSRSGRIWKIMQRRETLHQRLQHHRHRRAVWRAFHNHYAQPLPARQPGVPHLCRRAGVGAGFAMGNRRTRSDLHRLTRRRQHRYKGTEADTIDGRYGKVRQQRRRRQRYASMAATTTTR